MGLNELRDAAHSNAKQKGWWEPQEVEAVSAGLGGVLGGKTKVLVDRTFGELLALVHSEVSEALEEFRTGQKPGEIYYSYEIPREAFPYRFGTEDGGRTYYVTPNYRGGIAQTLTPDEFYNLLRIHKIPLKPEGIASELADVIIRVLDICGHYGIDIEQVVAEKMAYNATRAHRHGGKAL